MPGRHGRVLCVLRARPQAVFVLLLLPISLSLYGMAMSELPTFLGEGWRCFQGLSPKCGAAAAGTECVGAPLLPVAYVVANLTFNIAMLNLLRCARCAARERCARQARPCKPFGVARGGKLS